MIQHAIIREPSSNLSIIAVFGWNAMVDGQYNNVVKDDGSARAINRRLISLRGFGPPFD
jgi:hypothetical protein